jgi:Na+/H+-translocating membrane pyrophosphatase
MDNLHIDIYKADVLAGLFVGGMIPFIFSSLAISAVGRAAMAYGRMKCVVNLEKFQALWNIKQNQNTKNA